MISPLLIERLSNPAGKTPRLLPAFCVFSLAVGSIACGLRPRSSNLRSAGDVAPTETVLDFEGRVLWVGQDSQQGLCVRYSEIENNCVIVQRANEKEVQAQPAAGKGTCSLSRAQDSAKVELVCKTESGAACLQGISSVVVSLASKQMLLQAGDGGVALALDRKTRVRLDDQKCRNELGLIEKKGNDLRVAQAANAVGSAATKANGAVQGPQKIAGVLDATGQTLQGSELQELVNLFSARHLIAVQGNETHCLFFAGQNKPCWGYTRVRPATGQTDQPIVGPFNYTTCGFSRDGEETEQTTSVTFSAASKAVSPVSIRLTIAKNLVSATEADQNQRAALAPPFHGPDGERFDWAPKPCSRLPDSFPAYGAVAPAGTP